MRFYLIVLISNKYLDDIASVIDIVVHESFGFTFLLIKSAKPRIDTTMINVATIMAMIFSL